MPRKLTTEQWIERAEKVHLKGTYGYHRVQYKGVHYARSRN